MKILEEILWFSGVSFCHSNCVSMVSAVISEVCSDCSVVSVLALFVQPEKVSNNNSAGKITISFSLKFTFRFSAILSAFYLFTGMKCWEMNDYHFDSVKPPLLQSEEAFP